jgi:hypothetical protein
MKQREQSSRDHSQNGLVFDDDGGPSVVTPKARVPVAGIPVAMVPIAVISVRVMVIDRMRFGFLRQR